MLKIELILSTIQGFLKYIMDFVSGTSFLKLYTSSHNTCKYILEFLRYSIISTYIT